MASKTTAKGLDLIASKSGAIYAQVSLETMEKSAVN